MNKEFKITKEKILAMASECSEAKAVLKKGFPEAFIEDWVDVTENLVFRPYKAGRFYWIGIYQKGASLQIGWLDKAGANICTHANREYKIEGQRSRGINSWDNYFRILRRQ